jgi:hypothetical protein
VSGARGSGNGSTMTDKRDDRLDELDERIEKTRAAAEDANLIDDPDEPKFFESGDESDADDKTIAPPG